MSDWTEIEPFPDFLKNVKIPGVCKTAKCEACGRFTKTLHPVWSVGWPTPEILYEVGDCCKEGQDA